MLSDEFISGWVERFRREVPDAVGILLGGSQLHGDAGPYSDVDFDIVVPGGPRDEWPSWLDIDGDRVVRVSTWIRDADDSWRERLERPLITHPAGEPEIDHFEGEAGKVANAWHAGDELALRLAAQDLAHSVLSVLAPLNPRPPVRSRRAALSTVLGYDVVPDRYRDDILSCLGLAGAADAAGVHAAACRLTRGTLDLLDAHSSMFITLSLQGSAPLRDGSLRRCVEYALNNRAA